MTCLPFGLATAPQTFAKLTNWLANVLRNQGIRVVVYLDDFLLANQNPITLKQQYFQAKELLCHLGWHLNQEKTSNTPSQEQEYLGVVWNTLINTKTIKNQKKEQTKKQLICIIKRSQCTWLQAKRLLGRLTFASFVVPQGRLHCRFLQRDNNHMKRYPQSIMYKLSKDTLEDCEWWLQHLSDGSPIHLQPTTVFITTDASDIGWGASINGQNLSGTWNAKQQKWHCNRKELWTVLIALRKKIAL
ncbi:putative transposon Ty3-I Gag-Pol polyprotein [Operophtera brumata]|nr:putative transposon Ty3-I Gag-Pol polyprotein [Operophtera brumata]